MFRRKMIVAAHCVLLSSLPTMAQDYVVAVTFQNASSEDAIGNLHNDDRGAAEWTAEVRKGQSPKQTISWYAHDDDSEKYELSFTAVGGRKCTVTLHMTKNPAGCTIIDRQNEGLSCDAASQWGTFSIMGTFSRQGCEATLRFDR